MIANILMVIAMSFNIRFTEDVIQDIYAKYDADPCRYPKLHRIIMVTIGRAIQGMAVAIIIHAGFENVQIFMQLME